MGATHPVVRIRSRRAGLSAMICQRTGSPERRWRADDPPHITVAELAPEHYGKRVVIRAKDFLGSITGVLVSTRRHPVLTRFTIVSLQGHKALTLRGDLETIVVD